ncbi:MAG: HI0074 family nucleotidyltransferase substrate-binding subunit [Candidatus Kapabacteria bacterium]|nr:HI0074 family nucleotidyltransferase substrate-binding subunit [Candidatus Kapabacteria bacterium]
MKDLNMLKVERWKLRFENYEKAFLKLSRIVKRDNLDELELMALIQAFEFTFELAWKTLKDYLTENGFSTKSPKETLRQAIQSEYIEFGQIWMDAIEKRNESSHAYDDTILINTTNFIINEFYKASEEFYKDFKLKIGLNALWVD